MGTLQAPTTVSSQKQLSPLGQIASVGNAVTGGTAGLNSLLTQLGIKGGLSGLFSSNPSAGGFTGTNITGTTGTGDQGAQSPTLPDGSANPNYDAYADPNATQAAIDAQNAANQTVQTYVPPEYDANPAPDWSATQSYD